MGWWTAFVAFLKAFPKLVDLAKEAWAAILEWQRLRREEKAKAALAAAIDKSKAAKDTADLENQFNGGPPSAPQK